MPFLNKKTLLYVCFFAVLVANILIWTNSTFCDQEYWINKRDLLVSDLRERNFVFNPAVHSSHPGVFPLLISIMPPFSFLSPLGSLRAVNFLIDTLLTVFIIYLIYKFDNNSAWFLGASFVLIFNEYVLFTNPSDVIVSKLLLTAWILILLYIVKQKKEALVWQLVVVGVCLGFAMSTRIHMAVAIGGMILPLVWYYAGFKKFIVLLVSTLVFFGLSDPYLWGSPMGFISFTFISSAVPVTSDVASEVIGKNYFREFNLLGLISSASLAFLGYVMLILDILFSKKTRLPRAYLLSLFVALTVPTVILLVSSMNNLRFFYPAIFIGQVLVPLYLFYFFTEHARSVTSLLSFATVFVAISSFYLPALISLDLVKTIVYCALILVIYRLFNDKKGLVWGSGLRGVLEAFRSVE